MMNLKWMSGIAATALMLVTLGNGCQKDEAGNLALKSPQNTTAQLVEKALDPSDPDRRREGIVGLSQLKIADEKILKVYAIVASNPKEEPSVRGVALGALGRAKYSKYLPEIVGCLEDPSTQVRWDAAVAMDSVIGEAAIEPLRKHAISDSAMDVRATCSHALRHYKRAEVVGTLGRCLRDREFTVRFQAHNSLVELAGEDLGYESEPWLGLAAKMAQAAPSK